MFSRLFFILVAVSLIEPSYAMDQKATPSIIAGAIYFKMHTPDLCEKHTFGTYTLAKPGECDECKISGPVSGIVITYHENLGQLLEREQLSDSTITDRKLYDYAGTRLDKM